MNFAQKLIGTLGIVTIIYVFLYVEKAKEIQYVVIKYDDRLTEYVCKDYTERQEIVRKSDADVLFFDGEHLFEEPPAYKEQFRAQVIEDGKKVTEGIHPGDIPLLLFLIIILTLAFISSLK